MCESPSRSLFTSEVKSWSINASSEKFTTNASSCGFDACNQVQRALVHRRPLPVHRSRVVDHQRNRNRQIGVLKADDVLLDAVLKDLKVVLLQVLDQLVAVQHRAVQHHLFHVGAQHVAFALLAQRPGPGLGRQHVRRTHRIAVLGQRRRLRRHSLLPRPARCSLRRRRLDSLAWFVPAASERRTGQQSRENRVIAKAHSSPYVHKPSAVAAPEEDSPSPSLYATCRPGSGPSAGSRSHTGSAARLKSSPQCRPSRRYRPPGTAVRRSRR